MINIYFEDNNIGDDPTWQTHSAVSFLNIPDLKFNDTKGLP